MDEEKRALHLSYVQNKQTMTTFGRLLQSMITKKSDALLSLLQEEDEHNTSLIVRELVELINSLPIGTATKKKKRSISSFFFGSASFSEQCEQLFSEIEQKTAAMERRYFKLVRQQIVIKNELDSLFSLQQQILLHIEVADDFLQSIEQTATSYDLALRKVKELKTSYYVLLQLQAQLEVTNTTNEEMSLAISTIIRTTIPLWKSSIIDWLQNKGGQSEGKLALIREKQQQLLSELLVLK